MTQNTLSLTALAFDFGTQNIGVASGNSATMITTELTPLKAKDGTPNWEEIGQLLLDYQPDTVLVGLPLNMDDSDSELSRRAKKFGNRVHGRFGIRVEMVDERLTTLEAKEEAANRGHRGNYRHAPIDSIAARLILESWLRNR